MAYFTFSFDTEEYINPNAADGILRTAKILDKYGITGCYNVVARLGEALVKWGGQDIIDAISRHEIETHSMAHSFHPTINEYTDLEDFDEAMTRFLKEEVAAAEYIKKLFNKEKLYAACPPGCSTSYVAHYGYADMGIPCYDGDNLFDEVLHRPISCCNILCLDYVISFVDDIAQMSDEEYEAFIEKAAEAEYIILCNHPQRFYLSGFSDGINFSGTNTPEEKWIPSPTYTPEETEKLFEKFENLVARIKADPRFTPVTYREIAELYAADNRVITKETLIKLTPQLKEYFFPVTEPDSYCISDVMLACRDILLGKSEHKCGKVYGFLSTPYSLEKEVVLTAEEVTLGAKQIGDGFLPEKICLNGKTVGPAEWLLAALEVIGGAAEVTVNTHNFQIDLNQFPFYRDLCYKGMWLLPDSFEDRYLSNRFRLQSWTIRLPKGSPRKIFFK